VDVIFAKLLLREFKIMRLHHNKGVRGWNPMYQAGACQQILSDSVLIIAFGDFPLVVDFIGEACRPDCDRGHADNGPKHQRSPSEFGGGDHPDSKGEHASRD